MSWETLLPPLVSGALISVIPLMVNNWLQRRHDRDLARQQYEQTKDLERQRHEDAKELEASRFDHRHQERSEEAARTLIDLCVQAHDLARAEYARIDRETPKDDSRRPFLDTDEQARARLSPLLGQIRSHAHDLNNEKVRGDVELLARCLGASIVELVYTDRGSRPGFPFSGLLRRTWNDALRETVEVLGACLRDDPLPETPRLLEIQAGIDEWTAEQEEHYQSWLAEVEKERKEERERRKQEAAERKPVSSED